MNYHNALWKSIEHIANNNGVTCSRLAVQCGLDATAFNKSKQISPNGQPRWISTQTLAKGLETTDTSPKKFATIFEKFMYTKN